MGYTRESTAASVSTCTFVRCFQLARAMTVLKQYVRGLAAVTFAAGLLEFLKVIAGVQPFIILGGGVAVAASRYGSGPGVVASIAAMLVSSFFFLPPAFAFSLGFDAWCLAIGYAISAILPILVRRRFHRLGLATR